MSIAKARKSSVVEKKTHIAEASILYDYVSSMFITVLDTDVALEVRNVNIALALSFFFGCRDCALFCETATIAG